jgi:O-methyltransferase
MQKYFELNPNLVKLANERNIPYYIPFDNQFDHYKNNKIRINDDLLLINKEIDIILNYLKEGNKDMDILEFGTCWGWSLKNISNLLIEENININNLIGFDSLIGFPEEKKDTLNPSYWPKGGCSATNFFQNQLIDGNLSKNKYIEILNLPKVNNYNFDIIEGFYSESLKDDIIQKYNIKPPILINIDCDIYSSTLEVLDFIFRNKLYIKGKTMLRYDDWGCYYETSKSYEEEFKLGEARAHKEMCEKYKINCKKLGTFPDINCKYGGEGPWIEEVWFLIL